MGQLMDSLSQAESDRASSSSRLASMNVDGVLDGFRITSFSGQRAIINGPGGSRLVFNNEETVLGGVPWLVLIQKNGIEFVHQNNRVLLLFDRSLSSINRVNASSVGGDAASTGADAPGAADAGGGASASASAAAPAAAPSADSAASAESGGT
jgi:hypothetical protein